ncbi:MAG: pseudouridine synthase [Patescibacteria group bacterium]
MEERLQKILSRYGVASRRKAEELILNNQVKVNGKISKLGDKADISKDKILVNNKPISVKEDLVYYILNKPKGYVCSTKDRHSKDLITDLVPKVPKVWPVGRLDKDTTGIILLTNDGELTNKLTHPSFKHEKEYVVTVNRDITEGFLEKMKKGIKLEEGIAKADKIHHVKSSETNFSKRKIISQGKKTSDNTFSLVLHQGWKRQIRRMCAELNYTVSELKRIRIDKIELGDLKTKGYIKKDKLKI